MNDSFTSCGLPPDACLDVMNESFMTSGDRVSAKSRLLGPDVMKGSFMTLDVMNESFMTSPTPAERRE